MTSTPFATPRTPRHMWKALMWMAAPAAVWVTVGWLPALVTLVLIVGEQLIMPNRHVLSTAAVAFLVLVPIAWFLGSSLPLSPPSLRLNDNLVAHQLGGLAIWTLFLAACVEVRNRESDSP